MTDNTLPVPWDYLIVTASNDQQGRAYESQLAIRRKLGLLTDLAEVMVVIDPQGKRIGSGGSTALCLMSVLNRELAKRGQARAKFDAQSMEAILAGLRILIIHAGGDSRRLPAYGPCGKIFVPVPGDSDTALGQTLFDRILPTFRDLPPGLPGRGQTVVTSGDALILFDSEAVNFANPGMTALGCNATPQHASKHGVFCPGEPRPEGSGLPQAKRDGAPAAAQTPPSGLGGATPVRLFLQKPSPAEQAAAGAINRSGQTILDMGVMSFDAATAMRLLQAVEAAPGAGGQLAWSPRMEEVILSQGLDLYREICCALGSEATAKHHLSSARSSGSKWPEPLLRRIHRDLQGLELYVQVLPRCSFLHFGTTAQVISSGYELLARDRGQAAAGEVLNINTSVSKAGGIAGSHAWVEGCDVRAPLTLAGQNVLVGVDVDEPLSLPVGACIDVLRGATRNGRKAWFVRCYGIGDTFKDTLAKGGTFCGRPLAAWLDALGAQPDDIWEKSVPADSRSLWNARVFPAQKEPAQLAQWLWLFDSAAPTPEQKKAFLKADRYSAAEIAVLADQDDFYARRSRTRSELIGQSLRPMLGIESMFSAEELAHALASAQDPAAWAVSLLGDARGHLGDEPGQTGMETFVFCRVIHSLGAAVKLLAADSKVTLDKVLPGLREKLSPQMAAWLKSLDLSADGKTSARDWGARACETAFGQLNVAILHSSMTRLPRPHNALRSDETIWGRAPARLELGGGWTDTPPYTLEFGGSVINAAVNLNGQPPIHCYGRVISRPVIRLSSIDVGEHVEISDLGQLLDYHRPSDPFALVKACLAISGFSPAMAEWPTDVSLEKMLREFGGGIELTTLVGIPKGSGLGTSSIIGATVIAVIHRMMGRTLGQRELFHDVLRLEQAMTTGGGWQDQIGGAVGGTKITTTQPGMFPDPSIHYVPNDVLDPKLNGGSTLLYYTGVTRLAKNILRQVVGGYFNRNRTIMATLAQEHQVSRCIAEAMARKDAEAFGHYIDEAWRLQKQLCGDVTNAPIETLLGRIRPHIHGARILGAGSGGFMMMICKSPADAAAIRQSLTEKPINDRSRFFEFSINHVGLEVTGC